MYTEPVIHMPLTVTSFAFKTISSGMFMPAIKVFLLLSMGPLNITVDSGVPWSHKG